MAWTAPGPGRPKGQVNKLTRDIREMIRAALDGAGGLEYLIAQAHANPSAFLTLVGKIIPAELHVRTSVLDGLSDDQIAALLSVVREKRLERAIDVTALPQPGEANGGHGPAEGVLAGPWPPAVINKRLTVIRESDGKSAPRPPGTSVLYGVEWPAEDAAYARALAADTSIPTTELVRLWAEERPSVRAKRAQQTQPSPEERDAHWAKVDAVNGSPVKEIGGPATKPETKPSPETKAVTGRPPKGDRAMTAAERLRAYRDRKRGG